MNEYSYKRIMVSIKTKELQFLSSIAYRPSYLLARSLEGQLLTICEFQNAYIYVRFNVFGCVSSSLTTVWDYAWTEPSSLREK